MATQSEVLRFLLQGESRSLVAALQGAEVALDGTETAAERVAAQMSALAKVIESEGRQAAAATEALSAALGPELVASIEQSGGSVQQLVAELRQAGVAYDDLAANADRVAASLREVDAAGRSVVEGDFTPRVHGAADGVRRLGNEADQSRNVLANMVGNASQDLGALTGVAGTAGVALGQLAEYATDGNLSLKSMAAVGPALVGIGAIMYSLEQNAKSSAERMREMTEATKELSTVADEGLYVTFGRALANAALEGKSLDEMLAEMAGPNGNLPGLKRTLELGTEAGWLNAEMQSAMAAAIAEAERAAAQGEETTRRYGESTAAAAAAAERLYATHAQSAAGARYSAEAAAILRDRLNEYVASVEGIPMEKHTEILAALRDGDLARAEALINEVARTRVAQIVVSVAAAAGAAMGAAGSGISAAVASGAQQGSSIFANAIIAAGAAARGGGGGGGGSGGGKSAAELEADGWLAAMEKAYEYGQITRAEYTAFLNLRMAGEDQFNDEYFRLWKIRQGLEQETAREEEERRREAERAAKEAEAEAKRAADEAKRAAEERTRLAREQLDATRQLLEMLAGFMTAAYGNLEGTGSNVTGPGAAASMSQAQIGGLLADLLSAYQASVT